MTNTTDFCNETVHILSGHKPLCGFTDAPPDTWPENQVAVSRRHHDEATCEECLVRYAEGR